MLWFAASKKKKNLQIYIFLEVADAHMAGNPCEELSPTGCEKKEDEAVVMKQTRSYCTVHYRQFKDQVHCQLQ